MYFLRRQKYTLQVIIVVCDEYRKQTMNESNFLYQSEKKIYSRSSLFSLIKFSISPVSIRLSTNTGAGTGTILNVSSVVD